ncbi:MAG: NAD(P)-dependent oxidoreductase [Desulfobulbaceae bacterium]|nr:MAG: NAD(P)-dependent oxidoreductase [Desulfobulbaceae bacterium]
MKLGFLGLGHLGRAICARLVDCDHGLVVWNRTAAKAEGVTAEVAATPAEVAEAAEVIFVCMFDSSAVHDILTSGHGLLAADLTGKVIVDLTTNHFREVTDFHERCRKAGANYLEAPVLGSVVPAGQGALTVLVSGDRAAYDRVHGVLADIGKNIFFLGAVGLATKMKLINNLTLGSFMATIAEALALAEDVGIEREEVLDILAVGGGNSLVLNAKRAKLLSEDFSAHFSNALIYKDLHCLQDLAYEQKKSLFTGAVVKELYGRTFAEGTDQEDFSAVYKLFK